MAEPDHKAISKRSWLKKELESLIAAGRGGDRLPTYSEMVHRYQVGQATIDYVIQDLAAEGKIERRAGVGLFITSLAKQRSIGVIFDWNLHQAGEVAFNRLLIEKCRERVLGYGQHYSLYLHLPNEETALVLDHPGLVQDVKAGRLEGAILLGVESPRLINFLEEARVPHVLYSSSSMRIDRVGIDYRNLIEQGISALAYSGSRRIGLISIHGPTRAQDLKFRDDLDAFGEALEKRRLEVIPGAVVERRIDLGSIPVSARETQLETGYFLAQELFGGTETNRLGLDGLVVMDDFQAQGVLIALGKLGLRVPRDLRIATCATSQFSPLKCQSEDLILLEIEPNAVVAALFLVLEKWMLQGIRPQQATWVPVALRLPVGSPDA